MRPSFATAAIAVPILAAAFAAAPAHAAPEIPQAFQGRWSSELEACGNRESGLPFTIDATSITYFEEADTVVAVDQIDAHTIQVAVDYETYDGSERLLRTIILSDDQQKLMFESGDGPGEVNHRCPQGNPDGE